MPAIEITDSKGLIQKTGTGVTSTSAITQSGATTLSGAVAISGVVSGYKREVLRQTVFTTTKQLTTAES